MPIKIIKVIRVMFAGGGTGGHIYPLLAVHDYLEKVGEGNIFFSYAGAAGIFKTELEDRGIRVYNIMSSKVRRYFDLANFLDGPRFFISFFQAFSALYNEMPDVLFSKGGPSSFPVVMAARFYGIPVVIHESDSVPSVSNLMAAKFAKRVIVSFAETAMAFKRNDTLVFGNPVRQAFAYDFSDTAGSKQYFGFQDEESMLFVVGGSQGSQCLNNFVLDNLEALLNRTQVCHQVGLKNFREYELSAKSALGILPENLRKRYIMKPYFEDKALKIAYQASDFVLSRAGAGSIFEIAFFGKPSILVPLKGSANDHQSLNAYSYAKTGAGLVFEEENLKPNLILDQMKNILSDENRLKSMKEAARAFAKPDAARQIGKEILDVVGVSL